jgi:hypothetical protein
VGHDVGDSKESTSRDDEKDRLRKWKERNGVVGNDEDDYEDTTSKEDKKDGASGGKVEEDDNVTDFGTTQKCRWLRASSINDDLCPFGGSFRAIPPSVKRISILHKFLCKLLFQEGCTKEECVEVYFESLHCTPASSAFCQYGCIPLEIFKRCFPEIAKEKTWLDAERARALAEGDLRALGMSKKASKRFSSMLNSLAASTLLQRVPLFGSVSSIRKQLSKSERESMGNFLYASSAYNEGISILIDKMGNSFNFRMIHSHDNRMFPRYSSSSYSSRPSLPAERSPKAPCGGM